MNTSEFKENDFVWAKMAGYNHWPAIVMKPDPEAPTKPLNDVQWIYFLGTHNYAWIEDRNIKPYEEFKLQFKKKNTEAAMDEMEDIIENRAKDPDYKISFAKYISRKPSPKKSRKSSGGHSSEKKRPFKEKNTPVPRKKSKSSLSPETEEVDENETLQLLTDENTHGPQRPVVLNTRNLATSQMFFGFLADNIYAEGIIKNLIISGHKLNVWCRTLSMCQELQDFANKQQTMFHICNSPRQVVRNSQITFSCLADPDQAKTIINELGTADKNDDILKGKGYVEMTSIDPETSKDFHEFITAKGGIYLEAMLQGNRQEANKGEVIILAAGLQSLFVDCQTCFKAMSKASFLLGKIGLATKIHMIFQMMRGVFLASLAEGFAMADRCSIKLDAFNNIFKMTHMSSEYLRSKSDTIVQKKFTETEEPLQMLQKDLAQGLEMSNKFRQPMPLASNANEILKHARRLDYADGPFELYETDLDSENTWHV